MRSLGDARKKIKTDDFSFDEDIKKIFIEEAVEVLQSMDDVLPNWSDNPSDLAILSSIRRGFHTLKGSGRMVGANVVGEIAWAVESLLNKVIEQKVPVSKDLVKFINETKYTIPFLINDFANSNPPSSDPALIILKAENLKLHRDIYAGTDVEQEQEEEAVPLRMPPPVRIFTPVDHPTDFSPEEFEQSETKPKKETTPITSTSEKSNKQAKSAKPILTEVKYPEEVINSIPQEEINTPKNKEFSSIFKVLLLIFLVIIIFIAVFKR